MSGEASPILTRKDEHLDLALAQQATARRNPFDAFGLPHCALPELDLDDVDLTTSFLGRPLSLPFVVSSMTGGPARGAKINANLAAAAEALQIPFAVGSQRVALEGSRADGLGLELRRVAPTIPIWGNFGAAQLLQGYGIDEARRAVEMIGADALIIHLNPLQEAVQPGGDTRWRGVLEALERLANRLEVPLIVKEVGYGLSSGVARVLADAGVAAVDVAGAGGTAWALIEGDRARSDAAAETAKAFDGWGIPTPRAIRSVRTACADLPLIGSGGIRNGVDAAKAIALGADLVGQAGQVLPAAMVSPEAVVGHFEVMARQLRIACFVTGCPNLSVLRELPLGPA
ncbi:type 2 isopentenyl-diphosphate Delta-isomerase [Phenylobacterium sp.]|uniref:type 2 isopentenyl-diphosphate Delta-isomerase n=1 Tax=Phenylobacterium sp. TaxID=1871053 RepID=UPI002E337886|nr:type 2 isopentenyl-diphosphate Delta-isomerase [Phenylobacterium sp.]HEX2558857.1 type 2 isopentenyl-diphosphate Delta-isomerase [Phenylobacterium sp.]